MNNKRRSAINAIREKLQELHNEIESIRDEEQDAFDAMPESLQGSERGQQSENASGAMDDCICNLETAISDLEAACE